MNTREDICVEQCVMKDVAEAVPVIYRDSDNRLAVSAELNV
jgi:hypothetical protein